MCGTFVFLVQWGWGWSHLSHSFGPALGWCGVAYSQQQCACESIGVISNLFLPWTLFSLRFLNLQATDWPWRPVIPCFLCIMLQITAVPTHKFLLHSKHILCFCQQPIVERKSHIYSCTPVFKLASQSSLSAPGVSGEIEKECLLLDDGGWWGRKSTSHHVLVV